MQFQGDYAGNPPSMLKDMFKINLFKTMKKKFGPEMRHSFRQFCGLSAYWFAGAGLYLRDCDWRAGIVIVLCAARW